MRQDLGWVSSALVVLVGACSADQTTGGDAAADSSQSTTSDATADSSQSTTSDTSGPSDTTQPVEAPEGYPRLGAGVLSAVDAKIAGQSLRFVSDQSFSRGLLTYGQIFELDDGGAGDGELTMFGLADVAPGTYDQRSISFGLSLTGFDGISTLCDEGDPVATIIVAGRSGETIWGAFEGMICEGDDKRDLSGTRFTAIVRETWTPDPGHCEGTYYCKLDAGSAFECEGDPGCAWQQAVCAGQAGACAPYYFSQSTCEQHSGCVYFEPRCEGEPVIDCAGATTEFGCEYRNGCVWFPER